MKITVEFESEENSDDKVFESVINLMLDYAYNGKFSIISSIPSGTITLDLIEKQVCEFTDIFPHELQVKTRKREVVEARQICHYLAKHHTKHTLEAIGTRFGGKDHATTIYSNKTVTTLLNTDRDYREKYKTFINSFTQNQQS